MSIPSLPDFVLEFFGASRTMLVRDCSPASQVMMMKSDDDKDDDGNSAFWNGVEIPTTRDKFMNEKTEDSTGKKVLKWWKQLSSSSVDLRNQKKQVKKNLV